MTRPWDRRPDESAKAHHALSVYLDLGVQRSTAKVARALSKTKTLIDRWSGRHEWVARAAAWDAAQDEAARDRNAASLQEMRDRLIADALAGQSIALLAAKKFLERLDRGDPGVLGFLDSGDAKELLEVALAGIRSQRFPVAVEMMARGLAKDMDAPTEDGALFDEFVAKIRQHAPKKALPKEARVE